MLSPDAMGAVAAFFIAGMVWVRTRMHYAKGSQGERRLTTAGAIYFASLALLLAAGWFAAPLLARALESPAPSLVTRLVWFLAAYYLFIPVHRALKSRGVPVFRS
jgi:hypothetical protein